MRRFTAGIGFLLSGLLAVHHPCTLASEAANNAQTVVSEAAGAVDLVIDNVTVIPMTDRDRIEGVSIAVDDGRILAVAAPGESFPYTGKTVIDGAGKFVTPGLIDAHVHILTPFDAPLYPAVGVTTVRNMWGFPAHLEMRKQIAAGAMFGPRIVTAGRLIDGDPKIWPESLSPVTPEEARAIIVEDLAAGYDFVKVYSRLSPSMFDAIAGLSAEKGVPFAGHVPGSVDIRHAAKKGMRSMEHLWGVPNVLHPNSDYVEYDALDRSQWDNLDLGKLDALAEVLREHEVWIAPTLLVMEHIYLAGSPDLLRSKATGVEYVSPATVAFWDWMAKTREPATEEDRLWVDDVVELRGKIVKRLHEKGVRLLVGSDANNSYVVHGFALYDEIEMFVEAGIPLPSVLGLATRGTAEFLGMSDEVGTVEVGKTADLIVFNDDPTVSVDNLKHRAGIVVGGVYHTHEHLMRMLMQNRNAAARFADQMNRNIERNETH